MGKLILENKQTFEGESFGAQKSAAGEMVFATGMVGYPESLTDPSYAGQILILTYPLAGNYGVPDKKFWESEKIQVTGLIVSDYINTPSHYQSKMTLASWLKKENVPALQIKDTRLLAQTLRDSGAMLGKMIINKDIPFYDPNKDNLVAQVSRKTVSIEDPLGPVKKTIVLIDCGAKRNITRCFLKRGVRVISIPWDYNPFTSQEIKHFDALFISNGPGDPVMADKTIATIKIAMEKKIPILGICLGNQLLALAAGGKTYKLKFGHRGQNQPCIEIGTKRCYITTHNHGFAVADKMPKGFKPWFVNANDNSNEGIIHEKYPWMSVQFHPEAAAGPIDTQWLFDYFLDRIKK